MMQLVDSKQGQKTTRMWEEISEEIMGQVTNCEKQDHIEDK